MKITVVAASYYFVISSSQVTDFADELQDDGFSGDCPANFQGQIIPENFAVEFGLTSNCSHVKIHINISVSLPGVQISGQWNHFSLKIKKDQLYFGLMSTDRRIQSNCKGFEMNETGRQRSEEGHNRRRRIGREREGKRYREIGRRRTIVEESSKKSFKRKESLFVYQ